MGVVVLAAMFPSSGAMGTSPSQLRDPPHASLNQLEVREVGRLGVLADDPTQTFADIAGLAVDEDRDVLFVLDGLNHRLSAYTLAGEFIASTGRKGEGPGELMAPVAVVVDETAAHVMDWGANRVTRFKLDADSLRYAGELRLPVMGPTNLCRLQDVYYVMRYQEDRFGRIIHRIDESGHVTLSFGSPFLEGDALVANVTDDGRLVCDREYRRVYVLSRAVPRVRGYSAAGALLWDIQLPGVEIATIKRDGHGVVWSAPRGRRKNDRPVTLSVLPRGRLLVQVQEGIWGQPTDLAASARSLLIDGRRGVILDESYEIPRIELFAGNSAFSKLADFFPQVVIRRWTWRGEK